MNPRIATLQKTDGSRGSARPPHAALLGAERRCLAPLVGGENDNTALQRTQGVTRTERNNIDASARGGDTHRDSLIKIHWRLTFSQLRSGAAAIADREASSVPAATFLRGVNNAGRSRPSDSFAHSQTQRETNASANKLRGTRREGRAPAAPAPRRAPSGRIASCGPRRAACWPDRDARLVFTAR